MNDVTMREPCPDFRETQQKLRNTDMGSSDRWRIVKQARYGNERHSCNAPPRILNGPKCRGDITKFEIADLWQT